jgi:hypothetical protein
VWFIQKQRERSDDTSNREGATRDRRCLVALHRPPWQQKARSREHERLPDNFANIASYIMNYDGQGPFWI